MATYTVNFSKKEALEAEINAEAIRITSLSGEARESAISSLKENLYELLKLELKSNLDNYEYGLEFAQAADYCIRKYNGVNPFINYYRATRAGLIHNTINKKKKQEYYEFLPGSFGEEDDITEEETLDYISASQDKKFGENYGSFVEETIAEYSAKDILEAMSEVYNEYQDRSKPLISAFATGVIYEGVNEILSEKLDVKNLPFFNSEVFKMISKKGSNLSLKELAAMFGKAESNVSRSHSEFKSRLCRRLNYMKVA